LNSAGQVQVGGGTSIYRKVGTIPSDPCPKYLGATPVFDDSYLVSYKTLATGAGVINVMQVDSSRKATVVSSKSNAQDLYKVITLNQATGLFVSISQAQSKTTNTAVIAGKVDKANKYAITYGSETTYSFAASYSFDPTITALSETTFAIAFYAGSPLQCYTRWGKSIHYIPFFPILNANLHMSYYLNDNFNLHSQVPWILSPSPSSYPTFYHSRMTQHTQLR
jgi:hypothetical protein